MSVSGVDGADLAIVWPVEDLPNKVACETASGQELVASTMAYVRVSLNGQECNKHSASRPTVEEANIFWVRQHVGPRKRSCHTMQGGFAAATCYREPSSCLLKVKDIDAILKNFRENIRLSGFPGTRLFRNVRNVRFSTF